MLVRSHGHANSGHGITIAYSEKHARNQHSHCF
jgi:hypothetical protein